MSAAARKARNVCVISAGVVAVAAFLPWASVFGFSKAGIEGDGVVTLVCAVAGLALIWGAKLGWVGQLIPALLVVLTGLYDLDEAGNLAAIGLYLTFLAGIAWVVGAFMVRASRASEPATEPDDAVVGPDATGEPAEPVAAAEAEPSKA
jgi:hypothetical protein